MPRTVPTVRDWEGAAVETLGLDVSMDYPGGVISENRMYRLNSPRHGLKPVAKSWRDHLANSVAMLLLHHRVAAVVSVEGTIGGRFRDRGHAPDLSNLVKLISDAVERAVSLDDREYTWRTLPAVYENGAVPEIHVGLKLGRDTEWGEMIRSEQEYQAALTHLRVAERTSDEQRRALSDEVARYERTKRGDFPILTNIEGLGQLLVSLRIAQNMSQRELANKLGVHESQVSRYENTQYRGITVQRVDRILTALGARLRTTAELGESCE